MHWPPGRTNGFAGHFYLLIHPAPGAMFRYIAPQAIRRLARMVRLSSCANDFWRLKFMCTWANRPQGTNEWWPAWVSTSLTNTKQCRTLTAGQGLLHSVRARAGARICQSNAGHASVEPLFFCHTWIRIKGNCRRPRGPPSPLYDTGKNTHVYGGVCILKFPGYDFIIGFCNSYGYTCH